MSLLARYSSPADIVSAFFDDFYPTRRTIYPSNFTSYKRAKFVPVNEKTTNLEIELPGYKREQIEVYSEQNSLVVSAKNESEHSKRSYNYSFPIQENEKVERVFYESGILTIELTRLVPEQQKRMNYKIE